MTAKRHIPAETLASQKSASDPRNSVWVSANAGAGKTHVLSQRVVRLLLGGVDPSRILCLTYTRAAAANMSNRVFGILSRWAMLPDGELAKEIGALEDGEPDADALARARKLFTRALETPGGLKVQTIHAFCESVLHQFPLEANIAAHFQMLDSRKEEALFQEARRDMISGAADEGRPELSEAFAAVLERAGESGLDGLLKEVVSKRDGLRAFVPIARGSINNGERSYVPLLAQFGFGLHETAAGIAASVWPLASMPPSLVADIDREALALGAARPRETFAAPALHAFGETEPLVRLALLREAFLNSKGEPYKADWLFGKKLLGRMPDVAERYLEAAQAIIDVAEPLALFRMLEGTRAALTIAEWLIDRYEQLKTGRGFLDFNDLITRTVRLLSRPDAGPWVQYKLDKGIDHILLDEAQDTSPDQWKVVHQLAGEFFAGAGARDNVKRTVFAVGDEKQSIYSFQGASPDSFADSGREFKALVEAAERPFLNVTLKHSFRSTEDVLSAVDLVFADEEARRNLSRDTNAVAHATTRPGDPGYVELWPSIGKSSADEPEDWRTPVDIRHAPPVVVAERVAATIEHWLKTREILEGKGRRIAAGDIMVLVRKRDSFVHALSRSLKNRDVPVAGADRLRLANHIAIKDLIALGRHLVQPRDDLSLAAVLKSPIFGLSEDQLFALAADRGGMTLAQSLRQSADFTDIAAQLDTWSTQAAFKPVFEFYAGLLAGEPGRDGLRKRLIQRLGHEAGEILDEFLAFCLAEERVGLAGLEEFLVTLETAGPEIKREMDQKRDEVRILTVHASKGLEAPVVFLVDSGSAPAIEQHLPRLTPFPWEGGLAGLKGYLWRSDAEVKNATSDALRDELKGLADDEYRRLLYVGMTRAEDRLIVCGYHGVREPNPRAWHALVERALSGSDKTENWQHPIAEEIVLRYRITGHKLSRLEEQRPTPPAARPPLPQSLLTPLQPEEDLPRPLTPSGASLLVEQTGDPTHSTLSPVLDIDPLPGFAIRRGIVVHKLLQVLPGLEPTARLPAATRYLAHAASNWTDIDRQSAAEAVDRILATQQFAPIFTVGSRAEVAVMGRIVVKARERLVSGTIDRLAVTDDEVLIVDYKTNRPAPSSLLQVPAAYILQLSLYAELLKPLYPGKRVRAALLFTETPQLIEIPVSALDTALARLTAA